ncbi:hypothetical protein OUZ56_000999 [Daphnia magna]|uniref:Uncharacterized protein n=1 Tax=Daphnia magna TaxID=35525 RepID=A0ABR0A1D3_9CRUS|nr:hypothetical protein OUZ56_000999 [Daphnia magna]
MAVATPVFYYSGPIGRVIEPWLVHYGIPPLQKKGIPCASHMAVFAPTLALPLPGLLGIRQSQYPFLLTAITSNSSSKLTRNGNGRQHILLLGKGDGDHGENDAEAKEPRSQATTEFSITDKTNCCHQHAQLLSLVLEAHIDKRSWSVVPVLHCSDGPGFSLMMVQIMCDINYLCGYRWASLEMAV